MRGFWIWWALCIGPLVGGCAGNGSAILVRASSGGTSSTSGTISTGGTSTGGATSSTSGTSGAGNSSSGGVTSGTSGTWGTGGSSIGSATLQGPEAFNPNSCLAVLTKPLGTCVDPIAALVFLTDTTPAASDCLVFGDLSPGLTVQHELDIDLLAESRPSLDGTYGLITDSRILADADGGRVGTLVIYENGGGYVGSVAGTIVATATSGTVTVATTTTPATDGFCVVEMSGTISATVSDRDGGESYLSGTFETPLICIPP
jgi:hypothetical protein